MKDVKRNQSDIVIFLFSYLVLWPCFFLYKNENIRKMKIKIMSTMRNWKLSNLLLIYMTDISYALPLFISIHTFKTAPIVTKNWTLWLIKRNFYNIFIG